MPRAYQPIQWARQSEEGRQVEAGGGRLFNLYAVRPVRPQDFKVPVVLYGTPGYRRWAQVDPKRFRQNNMDVDPPAGIHALIASDTARFGPRLFGISSAYQFFEIRIGDQANDMPADYNAQDSMTALFDLNEARIHQFTLEDSERARGRVKLASDGRHIGWPVRRGVKFWDQSVNAFVDVAVPVPDDFSAQPDEEFVDLVFVDGYWILISRGGQFFHSDLNGVTFRQLQFASAESRPDPNVAALELKRQLFIFGSRSIERWFNSGRNPDFAFERDNSFRVETGCRNRNTLEKVKGSALWLGHDRSVWGMGDNIPGANLVNRVSTAAVDEDIQRSLIDQAYAWSYIQEGHRFYNLVLTFSDGSKKAWTYDIDTAYWHERSDHGILCSVEFNNLILIGRAGSPYIQDLRLDFGQADDEAIMREAITPVIDAHERRVRTHFFQVEIPRRPSEVTGDFIDEDFRAEDFNFGGADIDTLELAWTDDGGRTWKDAGREPRHLNERILRWTALGQFQYGRRFRVRTSARRRIQILGAYMLLDVSRP